MAKIQAVWAIDIGQAAVKALKLVPGETPDMVVAEAFDYIEYPKILSQPDADPEELVQEALQTFLGRNDVKGSRVAIAVPGQAGLVKFIKLPPVEKKRIPDIVKFEARQQIPFALEEVIWDYQQIGKKDDEDEDDDFAMVEVGLFAMKRDQIHRAILPLKAAGIEVDVVQMSPISLFNFLAFDRLQGDAKPDGSIVLLDIGADNTDLIISDGERIWQRNVPIGGNHFTRALTKELKLTFAKAEHLKRNATKSQDPRAVFTAMRGVFNDLSSEVSRSIGFYSSVNRQAKIAKVIGLGNGFKLPGLQKFLQQNLNYEVERLESFDHMIGEEVTSAPQFAENLMSFAVAYGLGLQGLSQAPLKTNLLPPEIEQVRMIRRKKPWALAGAALLMLAFTTLFLGNWRARAKVVNTAMETAVNDAKTVSQQGTSMKSAYDTAKSAFAAKKTEGEALVAPAAEQVGFADLFQRIDSALPNPSVELGLDANQPENQDVLSVLRVHVDAILPRYLADVGTEWFNTADLEGFPKDYMHPYDRTNPPSGEGWIIQIVGHHYNPDPLGPQAPKFPPSFKEPGVAERILGPWNYLGLQVLPRFWIPELRQFGISHATVAWIEQDTEWESSKLSTGNRLPPAPIIARTSGGAVGGGGGGMSGGGSGGMRMMGKPGMSSGGMSGGSGGMYGRMSGGSGGSDQFEQMMSGMSNSYRGMMGGGGASPTKPKEFEKSTLTRTNFMIQLVWKPPGPGETPKTLEEILTALNEAAKGQGAIKPLDPNAEKAIIAKSQELQQKKIEEQIKALAAPEEEGAPAAPAAGEVAPPAAAAAPTP